MSCLSLPTQLNRGLTAANLPQHYPKRPAVAGLGGVPAQQQLWCTPAYTSKAVLAVVQASMLLMHSELRTCQLKVPIRPLRLEMHVWFRKRAKPTSQILAVYPAEGAVSLQYTSSSQLKQLQPHLLTPQALIAAEARGNACTCKLQVASQFPMSLAGAQHSQNVLRL